MSILKLKKHNEKKEIEFELDFLARLTTKQRFELMFKKSAEMRKLIGRRYRKTTQIIMRKSK
jgi:hypothetical protein